MTATFGKLEHQTLTLKPGLNVIHAPNEWGKSTWCAFLVAMLYGIATKERTTQTTLADKERYAPWSGSPMSGRIDLCWNGRDITIERRTKGRSIFGDFKAYETATGLTVAELNASNCGQILLGVEKSVFTRAGFLKLTDLPVTDDEALRHRLNALVTTGDESGTGKALEQKLKELRNHCRYNRSGLLPQAEKQREELQKKLDTLTSLQQQTQDLGRQQAALEEEIEKLKNHRDALSYAEAQADLQRVAAAQTACETAKQALDTQRIQCDMLPGKEDALGNLEQLEQLQEQMAALQSKTVPPQPERPVPPAPFAGMTPEQAVQQANSDHSAFTMLQKPLSPVLLILATISLLAGVGIAFLQWIAALPFLGISLLFLFLHYRNKTAQRRDRIAVAARYAGLDPQLWVPTAVQYQQDMTEFAEKLAAHKALYEDLENRRGELTDKLSALTDGAPAAQCIAYWRKVIAAHDALQSAKSRYEQARSHADALTSMVKEVHPPRFTDALTLSKEQTQQRLQDANAAHQQLHIRIGQCMGQMESLGQEAPLQQELRKVQARIDHLEDTYAALTIAMETLAETSNDLQRRFAPRISQRAQTLFSQLTGSRYDRLTLSEDFSILAGTLEEDTLRSDLWRSDGTVDQLYLALRLAVADELTPKAPLILDDALVRFDDDRLARAMEILRQEAQTKQVILFTCQQRETRYIPADPCIS